MRVLVVVVALTGCGIAFRTTRTVDELPAGKCPRATLKPGESCTEGARDYAASATVSSSRDHGSSLGGTASFRMPMYDISLDERTLWRGTNGYHSLAGGIGSHLRPLIFWPTINRYLDPVITFGFELGGIQRDSHVEGRGDAYVGAAVDLLAPDAGPFRYLCSGVPALRIGVRYAAFVQGWEQDIAVDIGLVWRWGVPVDLYRHWTTIKSGE